MPSQAFLTAIHARETAKRFVELLRITHAGIDAVKFPNGIALAAGAAADVTSNSILYTRIAMEPIWPKAGRDEPAGLSVIIDNVDLAVLDAIRSLTIPPKPAATLSLVLEDTPNVIEQGPVTLTLDSIGFDALRLTCTFGVEPATNFEYPADSFLPSTFPALFT